MNRSVLTLTVNPALDRIITVDRLVFEDRAYIESTTEAAGGRGINAARVLTSFGTPAIAITTSGREVGRKFEARLQDDSFGKEIVKISNSIRINLTISDRKGLSIKLNERGPELSKIEQDRLLKATEKLLPDASWLMICGSLPPGVDDHFYTHLIKLATQNKVETLLDTDGEALLHGLDAHPTIVKPNQSEAERLLNTALITRSQLIDAVQRIKSLGAKSVVLSLGSRGAIAATSSEGILEITAPVFALIPGTSRSGATIIGGMLFGLSRRAATEFSFFLAIPTLFAATLYSLWKDAALLHGASLAMFGVGFTAAFVSAFACVRWLIRYISRHDFRPFAWYRIAFGVFILATAGSGLVQWP